MANALPYGVEARRILEKAQYEGRDLTPSEQGLLEGLGELAKSENAYLDVKTLGRQLGPPGSFLDPMSFGGDGPGDRFIASEGYKAGRDSSSRPQQWTTGMVEVSHSSPLEFKGTLLETGAGRPWRRSDSARLPAGHRLEAVRAARRRRRVRLLANDRVPDAIRGRRYGHLCGCGCG